MKLRSIFPVLISGFILSVPFYSFSYVFEKEGGIKILSEDRLDLEINGSRAAGSVYAVKGTPAEALACFKKTFSSEGYTEVSGGRNTVAFSKGALRRSLNIIPKGKYCSALV